MNGVDTPSLVSQRHNARPISFSRNGPARMRCVVKTPQQYEPTILTKAKRIKRLAEKRAATSADREHPTGLLRRFHYTELIAIVADPLFGVRIADVSYYVSIATLIDWRQNRIPYEVTSYPVRFDTRGHKREQTLGDRLSLYTDRHNIRRNKAGMGLAQEAYRLCRLDDYKDGIKLALEWLTSGDLDTALRQHFGKCRMSVEQLHLLARMMLMPYLDDMV